MVAEEPVVMGERACPEPYWLCSAYIMSWEDIIQTAMVVSDTVLLIPRLVTVANGRAAFDVIERKHKVPLALEAEKCIYICICR